MLTLAPSLNPYSTRAFMRNFFDDFAGLDLREETVPYNIEKIDETHYRLSFVVAGLTKNQISISEQENVLTITGKHEEVPCDDKQSNYLHQDIRISGFEHRFSLSKHMKVSGADLENGILRVDLVQEVPEEIKPKQIAITTH